MLDDLKIKILKFLDHWAGTPICLFLALLNKFMRPFDKFHSSPIKKTPGTILMIKFFGLGSILLSSPLLKSIKEHFPESRIIFLTFKHNAGLVKRLGICDEVRTIDVSNVFTLLNSILSNLAFLRFVRPEISIDLEFYSKFSTMVSYLSGARWRVGFYLPQFWRTALVNVPVYFNYSRHILEIYAMVGKAIGLEVKDLAPSSIPTSEEEVDFVEELLQRQNINRQNFLLGVNINASDLAFCRRWPREKFAQVINALVKEKSNLLVLLFGSQSEKKYTSSLLELLGEKTKEKVFDLSGRLTLGQFIVLLQKIDLFLTNDSGPLHLAKAQGTPTVSIWGPGSPELYGPYGREKDKHKVLYKRYPCSPCMYIYRTEAGYFCNMSIPCLNDIDSEEVIQAVKTAINQ